jgi:hypothetical protein
MLIVIALYTAGQLGFMITLVSMGACRPLFIALQASLGKGEAPLLLKGLHCLQEILFLCAGVALLRHVLCRLCQSCHLRVK